MSTQLKPHLQVARLAAITISSLIFARVTKSYCSLKAKEPAMISEEDAQRFGEIDLSKISTGRPKKEETGTHNPHKPTDPKPNGPPSGEQGANIGKQEHSHDVAGDRVETEPKP
jgi:hypothetical protein